MFATATEDHQRERERERAMEILARAARAEWATTIRTVRPALNRTNNRLPFPAFPYNLRRMKVLRQRAYSGESVITLQFEGDAYNDTATPPPPPPPPTIPSSFIEVKKKAFDLMPLLKGTSVFLLGIRCPIKTSVAELLADELDYAYYDSDEVLVDAFGGKSAAKAAKESDQEGFSLAETEVFEQLSAMGYLVVSAGDAAALNPSNLGLLRHGLILWIDVPLEMAKGLVGNQNNNLLSEDRTELAATYQKIKDGYANADARISMRQVAGMMGYDELESVTTTDMVLEVLNEIEKLMRVKMMKEEVGRPF